MWATRRIFTGSHCYSCSLCSFGASFSVSDFSGVSISSRQACGASVASTPCLRPSSCAAHASVTFQCRVHRSASKPAKSRCTRSGVSPVLKIASASRSFGSDVRHAIIAPSCLASNSPEPS